MDGQLRVGDLTARREGGGDWLVRRAGTPIGTIESTADGFVGHAPAGLTRVVLSPLEALALLADGAAG